MLCRRTKTQSKPQRTNEQLPAPPPSQECQEEEVNTTYDIYIYYKCNNTTHDILRPCQECQEEEAKRKIIPNFWLDNWKITHSLKPPTISTSYNSQSPCTFVSFFLVWSEPELY